MSFDMDALLKQAQEMQAQVRKVQEEAEKEVVEAARRRRHGQGHRDRGRRDRQIEIDPKAIDPSDPELLADLVTAASTRRSGRPALSSSEARRGDAGPGSAACSRPVGRPGQPMPAGYNAPVFSPSVENLVAQLTRLPGIGTRTAQRLAFHILRVRRGGARARGCAGGVKERVRFCRECGNLTEEERCGICTDTRRDQAVICVVEQPVDLVSLERTHEFRGLYHVLGGALPARRRRAERPAHRRAAPPGRGNGVQEVVLATNPNMTGEATAAFLADRLRGRVRVTRLASGLPVGGDLEYADEVTLGRALTGRREM